MKKSIFSQWLSSSLRHHQASQSRRTSLLFSTYLLILLFLTTLVQNSYAVRINSFSPSSGWAADASDPESGTLVRILGSQFDADPSDNEVFFSDGAGGQVLAPLRAVFTAGSFYEHQYTIGAPGSALGELNHPYDVAVWDSPIRIFVANQRNKRIEVFEFDGLPVRHIGAGDLDVIYGVAVGPADGNVYVAHVDPATSTGRISIYDQMGTHIDDLGESFLEFPQDLAVDRHGAVYVIDGGIGLERFLKINADDIMAYQHTGPLGRPFQSLSGITLENPNDLSGTLVYVTDRLTNNIYKYNSFGLYLERWDIVVDLGYPSSITSPGHIAADSDRDLYVDIGDIVVKLDNTGNVLGEVLDTSLLPPADFRTVDQNKKIYTVESSPPTIQAVKVFEPTDTEALLVHVPAGAQTGRITAVRHTPDQTHTSSQEFHVLEASGSLTAGDFEITQGLPTYPLVEGKPTLLYGDIEGFFGHPGRDVATLTITDSDGISEDVDIDYFSYGDDWSTPTTQIRFHIPPRILDPDTYTFTVHLERDGSSIYPPGELPWSDTRTVDGTKAMDLVFIKYSDVPNADWDTVDPFPWFDMEEFLYGIETFKRTYPLSPREISAHFVAGKYLDYIRDGVHPTDEDRIMSETQSAINSFPDCTPANLCVQRGVGLLGEALLLDTGNRGLANYNSNPAFTYFFEPTYRRETIWGGFLCHEVGHTLGLVPNSHINQNHDVPDHHSINMYLEDEDEQPFQAWNSHLNEFMSLRTARSIMYTGPGIDDVSFFESRFSGEEVDYPYLLSRVRNVSGSSSLLPPPLPGAPTPKMVIVGMLKEGGSLTIDESYVTEAELPLTPVRTSDYSVVFLDAADIILEQDTFEVDFSLDGASSGIPTEVINLIRPFPAGTRKVEIRHETDVLGSLVRSANPPSIGGLNINLALPLPVISWQASDADGDVLSYTILYSSNGGATFKPIVANIRESFYRWEHSLTPGSDNAVVKVIANDGFHQAVTMTPIFSLPKKVPQVAITVPSEGQVFNEGELIRLKGVAFDAEEGLLTGTSLQWKMGKNYSLGTGDILHLASHPEMIPAGDIVQVPFEVGTHIFKLTAKDNEGNEVSEDRTIEVVADTDRDGFSDDDETSAGTDPYDPYNRPYRPPVAVQNGQYKAIEGEVIAYDGRDSYDPDGEELLFDWHYSDGGSGSGPVDEHAFGDEGKYEVILTATDPTGLDDTDAEKVYVYNARPEVEITTIKQPNPFFVLPVVHKFSFTGSFSDAGWLDTHTFKWIFGDGTSASGTVSEEHVEPDATGTTEVEHAYPSPGVYTIKVELEDDDGDMDTDTTKVTVGDQIAAAKFIGKYIQSLPDAYFEKPAKEKKYEFDKMMNEVMNRLYQKDYYGAIKILKYQIRVRCDGYVDGNPKDDWLLNKIAQKEVCLMIDDLVAYLEYLLKGIKK